MTSEDFAADARRVRGGEGFGGVFIAKWAFLILFGVRPHGKQRN